MKKFLLLTAAIAFVGFSNAQSKTMEQNTPQIEKRGGDFKNFERFSKELNLDEGQKAKIMEINKKYIEEKAKIRSTGSMEDFKKLNERESKEIREVLTPEQVKRYDAHIEKRGGANAVRKSSDFRVKPVKQGKKAEVK